MKITITILLSAISFCLAAQHLPSDTADVPLRKKFFTPGARIGLISSSFTHNSGLSFPMPGSKSVLGLQLGATGDFNFHPNFGSRIELNYLLKGANEQFVNDKIAIQSRNKLSYLQLHILPVVLKTKIGATAPYLALGGYYARRIGLSSKWKPGADWEMDNETPKILNQKNDFGYSVSLGIRNRRWPHFEIRYEGGLKSVSSASPVKNRSIAITLSI